MLLAPSPPRRPGRVIVTVAVLVAVGLLLVALRLSWTGSTATDQTDVSRGTPSLAPSVSADDPVATPARAVRATADPQQFARSVAIAIFAWDTRAASSPTELVEPVLTIADPTGETSPGLVADLSGYFPSVDAWVDLRPYETRQRLEVSSVTVPRLWATALEQAAGELAPGTAAFTVQGTRHRTGSWEGELVTSEHAVAFTVFVVCAPSYPTCHLLRLSRLDDPLD